MDTWKDERQKSHELKNNIGQFGLYTTLEKLDRYNTKSTKNHRIKNKKCFIPMEKNYI